MQATSKFLAQIGDDDIGKMLLNGLKKAEVDMENIRVLKETPSGQAYIFILPDGQNSIVTVGGANCEWSIKDKELPI